MAKYALEMVPDSEEIGGGWEEVRGNWIIDSEGYIQVEGSVPNSPRWELSREMGTEVTVQVDCEMLDWELSQWGYKLRIGENGSFLWLRMNTDENRVWLQSFDGSSYETLSDQIPLSITHAVPYLFTASDDGDLIQLFKDDGTLVFSFNTDFNSGETRHGLLVAALDQVKFGSLSWADYAADGHIDANAPSIFLVGEPSVTIYIDEEYTDEGATAEDPLGNPLTVTTVSDVDNVEGFYTVTHSVTFNDITRTVIRNVEVRPENYLPVIADMAPIQVASGVAVTLIADVIDRDGDALTYQWEQVADGATVVELSTPTDAITAFVAPILTSNELLTFKVTVTDGITSPVEKLVTVSVMAAVITQRVSANTTQVSKFSSTITLTIPDEEGFKTHDVAIINKTSGEGIVNGHVEFQDGEAVIPLSEVRGVPYTGVISEGTVFPADNAQPVMGASTGEITCRSNELINSRIGIIPATATRIGDLDGPTGNFYTEKGGYVTRSGQALIYSPNGKFDHLNAGEEDFDYLKYYEGDIEKFVTIRILPSQQTGVNLAGTTAIVTTYPFVEGKTYEIAFSVTGMTAGEITPLFDVPSINDDEYSLSKNARECWHMKAPAGATKLTLTKTIDFDGEVEDLHIREVFKPEQAVSPRRIAIRSIRKSQPFLHPVLHPLFRIMDTQVTIDAEYTDELYFNSEFGVRNTSLSGNVSIVDAFCNDKRGAVSLRGGEHLFIDNLDVYCGYPTEVSRWQLGVSGSETNGPHFKSMVFINDHINLDVPSHRGNYSSGSNSDCIVFNSSTWEDEGFIQTGYVGNSYMYDPGDGVIDNKLLSITNYFRGENGWRTMRGHTKSIHIMSNTSLFTSEGTQCAIHVAYSRSRAILFNTYVNGNRMVDLDDMVWGEVLHADTSATAAYETMFIAKAMPNVTDNILFAFDEIHGQYKASDSDTWLDLPALYHNHPSALGWHLEVEDGTYDFRVKCILGTTDGGWTYLENQEVLNVTP